MSEYHFTLNIQAQANTIDDLVLTLDEVKEQISAGSCMAHNKNDIRRYALSIEKEKPFKLPEGWELKE